MKTISVSEASANLQDFVERAKQGEKIGIISGDQIIQLRPVPAAAWSESYLSREYDVTPEEWDKFKEKMEKGRNEKDYVEFKGAFNPNVLD